MISKLCRLSPPAARREARAQCPRPQTAICSSFFCLYSDSTLSSCVVKLKCEECGQYSLAHQAHAASENPGSLFWIPAPPNRRGMDFAGERGRTCTIHISLARRHREELGPCLNYLLPGDRGWRLHRLACALVLSGQGLTARRFLLAFFLDSAGALVYYVTNILVSGG